MNKQLERCKFAMSKSKTFVETIEPSAEALSVCALKEGQRLEINPFVLTTCGSFVQQIEPAKDAMLMEEVDEVFSWAFEQTCGLRR